MPGPILHPIGTKKFLLVSKYRPPIELTYRLDSSGNALWFDDYGGIWALRETQTSTDPVEQCGVGFWSWRSWFPWFKSLVRACKSHDYMYECPAWQAFHTREESDEILRKLIQSNNDGSEILGRPFKSVARNLGSRYWENDKTNN